MIGCILSIDPGEKRLGIAISDPLQNIARPLTVIKHVSRTIDAISITQLAREHEVTLIIVGQALDVNGDIGPQGRKAQRLAETIRMHTDVPVNLWDESDSTKKAKMMSIALHVSKRKRRGHLDDQAAMVILQSYLDEHSLHNVSR